MQLPPQPQQCSIRAARRVSRFSTALLIVVLITAWSFAKPAFGQISLPQETSKAHGNDEAASILRHMAETYARLTSLQQHSVYTSTLLSLTPEVSKATLVHAIGDAGKSGRESAQKADAVSTAAKQPEADVADDSPNRRVDRTVDLLFVQPNLLRITDSRTNAINPAQVSKWVSDGKTYSTFVPKSHGTDQLLYTQEKAPRSIRGFTRLQNLDGGSLELVMLMGINPFQNLSSDLATVLVDNPAIVRGVETEVITMIAVSRSEHDVLHLYIGKEDHLLHRFVSEVSPIENSSASPRIGDVLDEIQDESRPDIQAVAGSDKDHPLEEGDTHTGGRTEAKRTRVVYDNIYSPVLHVEHADFAFTPPTGAALFQPVGTKQAIDPNSKRLADIIRKSIEGHTKPVHDVTEVHEISP